MKLTTADRAAFVRAVLDDVPKVDYNEQARKIVMDDAIARLPKKIQAIWNDNALRGFIKCDKWVQLPGALNSVHIPNVDGDLAAETRSKLEELNTAHKAQMDNLRDIELQLKGTISGYSTLKQALAGLPEFAQYLPADRDRTGVANLPAVANVVSSLVRAGWPKNDKNTTK